jgi:hypothetical protein
MKTISCAILLATASHFLNAADITVNNNPNAVADYTSLQTAVLAAESGDRIFVAGSAQNYGNISIYAHNVEDDLTIIGNGYLRDANGFPADASGNNYPATFGLWIYDTDEPLMGLTVIGCNIDNYYSSGTEGIHDLVIDRCYIADGWGYADAVRFERLVDGLVSRSFFEVGVEVKDSSNFLITGSVMKDLSLENGAVASYCDIEGTNDWNGTPSSSFPFAGSSLFIDATSAATGLIFDNTNGLGATVIGSLTYSLGIGDSGITDLSAKGFDGTNWDLLDKADVYENTGVYSAASDISPDVFATQRAEILLGNLVAPDVWETQAYLDSSLTGTFPGAPNFTTAPYDQPVGATGGPLPYKAGGATDMPVITEFSVPAVVSPTSGLNVQIEVEQNSVSD